MALIVEEKNSRFRVKWQGNSIQWLPDTASNRKTVAVSLRLLLDEKGKRVFTLQELSALFDSDNRQASSGHIERFRKCGSDFLSFLTRKRKVDSDVVNAVIQELADTPLAEASELQQRVNERLGRSDLSLENITVALEQISCQHVRRVLRKQIATGKAHYKEKHLLEEMMSFLSCDSAKKAGIQAPEPQDMSISDPSSVRKLVTPDAPVSSIHEPLRWIVFCLVLYYHGVKLSVLGDWLKVHKTTILRRMLGLVWALWPMVYKWIIDKVQAKTVYIDEKWLKIRGRWHYWFVVLDVATQLPVLSLLLPHKNEWACRWIGVKLKCLGKVPKAIITDGLLSYHYVLEGAKHFLCQFHHQQGVTRWLKKKFSNDKAIDARKSKMKKVFQTDDKRTVRRRLRRLKEQADELGIQEWVAQTEGNLPKLLPSVGSLVIPRTTNAIERFFRAFNRFYKTRCGFFTLASASRELILFMLVYVFLRQPESGKAPIESIIPEATEMPLYKLINDPLGAVLGLENVKKNVKMADFPLQKCIGV